MRLEINIADEGPEARILSNVQDPGAFLLDLVRRFGQISKLGTRPNYLEFADQIAESPNFKSKEEIDHYIAELRAEW